MEIPESPAPIIKINSLEDSQYSQNQEKQTLKLPPLHLSKEQLLDRINSLKDYSTYKQTKAKRINLKNLTQKNQPPIVSCALHYGSREGKNQVLEEFIKSHNSKSDSIDSLNKFQQLLEESNHRKIKPKLSRADPSFISYKSTDEKEMPKINKMVSSAHLSTKFKKRSKTELPENSSASPHSALIKYISFPKELAKMKIGLRRLPVLQNNKQINNCPSQGENPENIELKNTLSIESHIQNESSFAHEKGSPKKSSLLSNSRISLLDSKVQYISCLKSILHRSGTLLNNNQPATASVHSSRYYESEQADLIVPVQVICPRKKKLRYWPSYSQYSFSQADDIKLRNLAAHSTSIINDSSELGDSVRQLDDLIKQQLKHEEKKMVLDFLHNENNNLGNKFNYLIGLEQQRYKKTSKELAKIKKEFYLERTREQIRANGIKRFKNFKDNSGKKMIPEAEDQQD